MSKTLDDTDAGPPAPTPDDEHASIRLMRHRLETQLFDEPAQPVRVGRFQLRRRIGAGAMGVVYAGYDDTLDREVALKLIRRDRLGSPDARQRVLREARAMARVSHPNVVHVYEAGEHDQDVFIAMELVAGGTLQAWLSTEPAWPRRLEVLIAAGRGLAAAHRAGVVHRDFKPDNVLMSELGEPKVGDFGLAGPLGGEASRTVTLTANDLDALTRTGTVVGTPRYMAPEQFEGRRVDARSDQFSFCVAAYEILYGTRPFEGSSAPALAAAVTAGNLRPVPTDHAVPRWIGAVLTRGLAVAPDDRFASLDDLLLALQHDPGQRRRKWILGSVAASSVIALALAGFGMQRLERARKIAACERESEALTEAWNAPRGEDIARAFVATDLSYARATWDRVEPRLDAYAAEWQRARGEVCFAAEVDPGDTTDHPARARACLDEARVMFESVVERLQVADDKAVQQSLGVVLNLPRVADCTDPVELARRPAPQPDATRAQQTRSFRDRVAVANASASLGDPADALARAQAVADEAETAADRSSLAAARLEVGHAHTGLSQYAEAELALKDAYFEANVVGDEMVALQAAALLVRVVGEGLSRDTDAEQWYWLADLQRERMGLSTDDPRFLGAIAYLGMVRLRNDHFEEARATFERALAVAEREFGAHDTRVGQFHLDLSNVHLALHEPALALAQAEQALAIDENVWGEDHPEIVLALLMVGRCHMLLARHESAEQYYLRAQAILEQARGADRMMLARILEGLARVQEERGDLPAALDTSRRVLALVQEIFGPRHEAVAAAYSAIGNVQTRRGAYDDALAAYQAAHAIAVDIYGPEHSNSVGVLSNMGMLYHILGRKDEALATIEQALSLHEAKFGKDDLEVAQMLNALANVQIDRQHYDEAVQALERAQTVQERELGPQHPLLGATIATIGRAYRTRGDFVRALPALERALRIEEIGTGPDDPSVGRAHYNLGELYYAWGKDALAIASLERSLSVTSVPAEELGDTRMVLARALWRSGKDRERATRLVSEAQVDYRRASSGRGEPGLADAQAWLAEHAPP